MLANASLGPISDDFGKLRENRTLWSAIQHEMNAHGMLYWSIAGAEAFAHWVYGLPRREEYLFHSIRQSTHHTRY